MLPETLQENELAAAVAAALPEAVLGGHAQLGELTLEIAPASLLDVLGFLKRHWSFERLSTVTAVDRYPMEPRFEVVYHLQSVARNLRIRIKAAISGEAPEIASATAVYLGANWYERETFDLFGIVFTGHPNLKRIMMPDDWQGYPLRRDFPTHGHKYSYKEQQ